MLGSVRVPRGIPGPFSLSTFMPTSLVPRLCMELPSPVPSVDEMSAQLILQPVLAQIKRLRPQGTGDLLMSPSPWSRLSTRTDPLFGSYLGLGPIPVPLRTYVPSPVRWQAETEDFQGLF